MINLGDRFGCRTVKECRGRNSSGNKLWRVQCDCGSVVITTGPAIRKTRTCRSCANAQKKGRCIKSGRLSFINGTSREDENEFFLGDLAT